jgi:hypothetical protein
MYSRVFELSASLIVGEQVRFSGLFRVTPKDSSQFVCTFFLQTQTQFYLLPGFFCMLAPSNPGGHGRKAAIVHPIAYKGIFDCRPAATEGKEFFLSTIECESCKVPQSDDLIARVHTTCRDWYTRPDRKRCRGFHAASTFAQESRRLSVPNEKNGEEAKRHEGQVSASRIDVLFYNVSTAYINIESLIRRPRQRRNSEWRRQ